MHEIFNLLCINESDIVKTINVYSANSLKTTLYVKLVVMNQYKLVYINSKNAVVFVTMHIKVYYN